MCQAVPDVLQLATQVATGDAKAHAWGVPSSKPPIPSHSIVEGRHVAGASMPPYIGHRAQGSAMLRSQSTPAHRSPHLPGQGHDLSQASLGTGANPGSPAVLAWIKSCGQVQMVPAQRRRDGDRNGARYPQLTEPRHDNRTPWILLSARL